MPWARNSSVNKAAERLATKPSGLDPRRRLPLPPKPRWVVPTPRRLRAYGDGYVLQGLERLAMRNPLYRFVLARLPFGGATRGALAAGCGCVSCCGCASGCCSVIGCTFPLIIILLLIFGMANFLGNSPAFATPLFCEANQIEACGNADMRLQVQIDEIPPGAVEDYKAIEAETGVPWFYLLAWEKVATDFGRTDGFPGQSTMEVPGDAVDASYDATEVLLGTIEADDGSENTNPEETPDPSPSDAPVVGTGQRDAGLLQQMRDAKTESIDKLRSSIRGGSFGLSLITLPEWREYGIIESAGGETELRDAWDRRGASAIVAEHIVDGFAIVAENSGGSLTSYSTELMTPLHQLMRDYISNELAGPTQNCFRSCTEPDPEEDLEPDRPRSYYEGLVEHYLGDSAAPPPVSTEEDDFVLAPPLRESRLSAPFGPSSDPDDPPLVVDGTAYEHFHSVMTFDAAVGSNVLAAADGNVTVAEQDNDCRVRCVGVYVVRIAHADGYETGYLGLSGEIPSVGSTVTAGERIGAVGTPTEGSGFLDFGLRLAGDPIDPASLISDPATSATPPPATDTYAAWPAGPAAGKPFTPAELYLICNELKGQTVTNRGGTTLMPSTECDPLRLGQPTLEIATDAEFVETVSRFYDPTLAEGDQVTDWSGMQVLMGAVLEEESFWGSDSSAWFDAPLIDAEGNVTNQSVRMNAYVVAINSYARSAYEAWAAAAQIQPEGTVGGLFDTDGIDMQFWRPAIDEAAAEHNIAWQYLAATLRADNTLTCATTDEAHILRGDDGNPLTLADAAELEWVEGADYFEGRDGTLLSTVTPTPLERCYRFGRGTASQWGTVVTSDGISHSEPVAAMNYCEWGFRHAGTGIGNCGTAIITNPDNGVTIEVPVVDYCNCWTGVPTAADSPSINGEYERMIDLNATAIAELGLGSAGLWEVDVTINPPANPIGWPGFIQRGQLDALDNPRDVVNAIALELSSEMSRAATEPATMLDMYGAWRGYAECTTIPGVGEVEVVDPLDPEKILGRALTCDFVDDAAVFAYAYFASGGGVQGTLFGRQPVSAAGYIWPVVGFPMSDGYTPRTGSFAYLAFYDSGGRLVGTAHDALDIAIPCGRQVVLAAKDGVLTGGRGYAQIRHDDGLTSIYGHMQGLVPAVANRMSGGSVYVERGELIGIVGDVGSPGACHLHYGIFVNGAQMGPGTRPSGSDQRAPYFWANQNVILRANPSGGSLGWLPLRIDPLHVLPQDETQLIPRGVVNGRKLYLFSMAEPGWYYRMYPNNNGFPPPIDAAALRSGTIRLTNGVVIDP